MDQVQMHTLGMVLSNLAFLAPWRLARILGEKPTYYILSCVLVASPAYHGYCYFTQAGYDDTRFVLNTIDQVFAVSGILYFGYFVFTRFRRRVSRVGHTMGTLSYVGVFLVGNQDNALYEWTHAWTHIHVSIVIFVTLACAYRWQFTWKQYFNLGVIPTTEGTRS